MKFFRRSNLTQMGILNPLVWLASLAGCGAEEDTSHKAALEILGGLPHTAAMEEASQPAPSPEGLAGRWGVHIEIPLSWDTSVGVKAGHDNLVNLLMMDVRQEGGQTQTRYRMCGMVLPATSSALSREKYQLLPNNKVFDSDFLAWVEDRPQVTSGPRGPVLSSQELAFEVGVALNEPHSRQWPKGVDGLKQIGALVDYSGKGQCGMGTAARTTDGFEKIPASITMSPRLEMVFLAVRNVIKLKMSFSSSDLGSGFATAQTYTEGTKERPMLNSLIVSGIYVDGSKRKVIGGEKVRLLNDYAPAMSARTGKVRLVKLPDDATCQSVRDTPFPL